MAWADVEWSSGDTATEAKLDQMYANLAYLRDEMEYAQVASSGWSFGVQAYKPGNDSTWEWRIALSYGSATSTARTFNSTEYQIDGFTAIDISGLQDNHVHAFDVYVQARPSGGSWATIGTAGRVYFLKDPDVDRLALSGYAKGVPQVTWTQAASSYCVVYLHSLQVAGHRVTGSAAWVTVDFVGATPGPAELISDTDMNGMLIDSSLLLGTANRRAICSDCLYSTGAMMQQTTDDTRAYRVVLRVDGVEAATYHFTYADGWTEREVMNLDVASLPDWYLCKATVIGQYQQLGVWYDGPEGPLAEALFWNTPHVKYVTLRGVFRAQKGQSPGLVYWSTYRTIEYLGLGLFATGGVIY